mmetsp:Transcript_23525/g.62908  ORF Transcript_23525/g.62908 Transcript_23525/m.62908 type:complete len:219 (+) Transcript_23525:120-776(+)
MVACFGSALASSVFCFFASGSSSGLAAGVPPPFGFGFMSGSSAGGGALGFGLALIRVSAALGEASAEEKDALAFTVGFSGRVSGAALDVGGVTPMALEVGGVSPPMPMAFVVGTMLIPEAFDVGAMTFGAFTASFGTGNLGGSGLCTASRFASSAKVAVASWSISPDQSRCRTSRPLAFKYWLMLRLCCCSRHPTRPSSKMQGLLLSDPPRACSRSLA